MYPGFQLQCLSQWWLLTSIQIHGKVSNKTKTQPLATKWYRKTTRGKKPNGHNAPLTCAFSCNSYTFTYISYGKVIITSNLFTLVVNWAQSISANLLMECSLTKQKCNCLALTMSAMYDVWWLTPRTLPCLRSIGWQHHIVSILK